MGFGQLRLIAPADHLSAEALMLAHGSHDVLEQAGIYASFDEAVSDIDLLISTTAKKRSAKVDYLSLEALPGFLAGKGTTVKKAGILFGTEESGLPNDLIRQSDLAMTIPLATTYPSLNLAQAVMITAYELGKSNVSHPEKNSAVDTADPSSAGWKELRERMSTILEEAGIKEGSPLFHRILERSAHLDETDIHLLHSVSARVAALLQKKKEGQQDE